MPAILKILTIFSLILILNRLRLQLHLSLFIGSLVLALWMGLGPVGWIREALSRAGWFDNEIQEAFSSLKASPKQSPHQK